MHVHLWALMEYWGSAYAPNKRPRFESDRWPTLHLALMRIRNVPEGGLKLTWRT